MTVHSLVLFENGEAKELLKEFDLSIHNSMMSPDTEQLVEDNYMTILYPEDTDKEAIVAYTHDHEMNLIESWELPSTGGADANEPKSESQRKAIERFNDRWGKLDIMEGYKMCRIHYWTEMPTHWTLNPDSDLFVFNSEEIKSMVLFN